ncbi:MAG: DJ-1/PfpI family protein [Planctomycetaceae bacterium]|jgi:putative intracellular protease/amidase|nr:DJ-1/PfpI family protein [Planctomycetaceae bacterium]
MAKKVAVLAVNPVNGAGLFQYLEAFFENEIPYKTFAVAETTQIKTNSGISLQTDDVVANLKGNENKYEVLVFACGDAMPKFAENADKIFNQDMLEVIKTFDDNNKILVGHCAAALLYDNLEIGKGKKVALHPFIKSVVKGCIGTDEQSVVDGNIYTAQTENSISALLPNLLKALK